MIQSHRLVIDNRSDHTCGVNLQLYKHLIRWVLTMSWIKKELMLVANVEK